MKKAMVVLLGVAVVGAGLRLYGLDAKALWLDETLSWRLQSFPLAMLVQRTGSTATVHPPLYFIVLHYWAQVFGDSHLSLRFPSMLFGVLASVAMYPLARDLARMSLREDDGARSRSAGLLAACLVAVSPYHVHAAHQVRPYTLGILLAVLSTWLLLRALAATMGRAAMSRWVAYGVAALAFCFTHNLALFSVCAQALFATVYLVAAASSREGDGDTEPRRRAWRRGPMVAGAILVLGYLPWVPNSFGQAQNMRTSWVRSLRPVDLVREPAAALVATADSVPEESLLFAAGVLAVLVAALAMAGVVGRGAGPLVLLMGIVPPLLILLYSTQSMRSIFIARYFAFAQPFWLIAFAMLACRAADRPLRWGLGAFLLMWSVFSCGEQWEILGRARQPAMPGAVEYILSRRSTGEPVIAKTPEMLFKLLYYSDGSFRPLLNVSSPDRYQQAGAAQLIDADLATAEEIFSSQPDGFWTVSSTAYRHAPPAELPIPRGFVHTGTAHFNQDMHWERPIEVRHFRRE